MRKRLTDGLSLSSEPAGGLPSPSGEWKSGRWSSRSLPSYELQDELRLSAGERPRTSCRLEPCCGCCGGKPDGVTRSRGGEMGSDLMFMLWLVLIDRLEPWGRWPPPLRQKRSRAFCCWSKTMKEQIWIAIMWKASTVDVWFSMISQSTVGVAFMWGRLESVLLFVSVLLTPKN